jgi:hypothetical protein
MRGLDPRIHRKELMQSDGLPWVKPGNDDGE